jgi:hypothetical protein
MSGPTQPGRPGTTAILVVSCDRYADLWEPFFALFDKYWPDCPYQRYLGSNEKPFVRPGVTGVLGGPDDTYSTGLMRMLRQIPEDYVIFWVEDRYVSGPVATAQVRRLVDDAIARGAGYLKLIPEHPLAYHERAAEYGEVPPGTRYRLSMTVALWRKETLLALLDPRESAWELEHNGTQRSHARPEPFLALSPRLRWRPPIPHRHLIVKGRVIAAAWPFLRAEGVERAVAGRVPESTFSRFYTWGFHRFWGLIWRWEHRNLRRAAGPQT